MSLLWIFAFLAAQRLIEVMLSRRNLRRLAGRGGREFYPKTFRTMICLHSTFLTALLLESHPWRLDPDRLSMTLLALLCLLQGFRYWCIASLGSSWNTRIVLVPGGPTIRRGPYRYLRHPNYLVVTLEFLLLPVLMHALWTLAVFFPANLLVLRQRIRLEEQALREFTDYAAVFPDRCAPERTA